MEKYISIERIYKNAHSALFSVEVDSTLTVTNYNYSEAITEKTVKINAKLIALPEKRCTSSRYPDRNSVGRDKEFCYQFISEYKKVAVEILGNDAKEALSVALVFAYDQDELTSFNFFGSEVIDKDFASPAEFFTWYLKHGSNHPDIIASKASWQVKNLQESFF